MKTCKDYPDLSSNEFDKCCTVCHHTDEGKETDEHLIEILDKLDKPYARVCCVKATQVEMELRQTVIN